MERTINKVKLRIKNHIAAEKAYLTHLLFPLKLFPLKVVIYFFYYPIRIMFKLAIELIHIAFDMIIFPFKSLRNFLKSIAIAGVLLYMFLSLFVIFDYIRNNYGYIGKFLCNPTLNAQLHHSVVRVVGGYSEGSGFFISGNQVLTNFHVIDGEPSPKIIFPSGQFTTPIRITGDSDADLAVLYLDNSYPDLVLPVMDISESAYLMEDEMMISAGYPLGTDITGEATIIRGKYISTRYSKHYPVNYLQTDMALVPGMSGGPLVDQCGKVAGVNTLSLSGQSLFISAMDINRVIPKMTDQEITKIDVDPSESPQKAVEAFYTYLKARRMEDGYNLLSTEYLKKTNFTEWTNRFTDILDVEVISTQVYQNSSDTVFIKFTTKNWNGQDVDIHYYEGTWQTIKEGGEFKMLKSNIKEITDPSWEWFYSNP